MNSIRRVVGMGLALLLLAMPAQAQETAADFIEPRVERSQYETFIQRLGLGRDQRTIADLSFGDYTTALTDLARQTDEIALSAGRQTLQDAFAGKSRMAPDEIKRVRTEVLKVYQQIFPAVDAALEQLLVGIQSTLLPEQEAAFETALLDLHRRIHLHPRQVGSQYEEYAGDGVDVLLLAEEACKEGGELAGLDPEAIGSILAHYEFQVEAYLMETAAAHREGKLLAKIASVQKDAAAIADLRQAAITCWKRLYQLNQSTVRSVGDVAAANLGAEAQQRWLERFDRECFTWMYPRKAPDRQFEWMNKQALTPEQTESAQQIYDQYLARRNQLNKQAIDLMIRARLEFHTMLYSMMDTNGMEEAIRRGHEQLLKNSGEQESLETTTSASLEGLLNEVQRRAMRDAVRGPDRANRRR